jgi:HPt (histidine-containing phosphotransfer) domain-containing protein
MEHIVTELPSSLPGIDVASGLPRVAGNQKLYVKLLRHVAAESPSTKEKLAAAIMEGNADQVREIAHSLKGAAANLSITEVAAAAEKLEQAAKAGDFSMLVVHLEGLESALDAFVGVVNTLEGL